LGIPADAGATVKDALAGRKKLLKDEKNALYKKVFEASPEVKAVPLFPDDIRAAIPVKEITDDLSITAPEAVEQTKLALARFGLDTSEDALALLESRNLTPEPLTVGNFDRFRKTLNLIARTDKTGAAKVITGPVKEALDAEAVKAGEAIKKAGLGDDDTIETLNKAIERVTTLKTEFAPETIVGKLTAVKRDGKTPVVEASQTIRELIRPGAPIENLERTIKSLGQSGKKGKQAIGDIQASVVLNALEDALKAPSRKTSGIQTVGGNSFSNSLEKIGDDKLAVIFANSPKKLAELRGLKQTALDITPDALASPRGSAPVMLDIVNSFLNFPGVAAIRDTVNFVVKAGADERSVRRALQAKPGFREQIHCLCYRDTTSDRK